MLEETLLLTNTFEEKYKFIDELNKIISKFESDIFFSNYYYQGIAKDDLKLCLIFKENAEVKITINGNDETQALNDIKAFINNMERKGYTAQKNQRRKKIHKSSKKSPNFTE